VTLALAHPGLLWTGLGLVAVPILIHFFFRRRHRVVRWAAMDLLLAALRKQRRRIEVENLILLLLRCAAIALFGLALARPAARAQILPEMFGGGRGVVLVVDTSASMGAQSTGRRALDRARERARRLLDDLPEASQVTLVVTRDDLSGGAPSVLIEAATPANARERLEKHLLLSHGANDLAEVFRFVRGRLDNVDGRKLVAFATDLQARDWVDAEGARREDVHRALRSLGPEDGEAPPVRVLDVGGENLDNAGVAELTLDEGREAFADTLLGLNTVLVNYGEREASGTLTLFVGDGRDDRWEKKEAREVRLAGSVGVGEPVRRTFPLYHALPKGSEGGARFKVVYQPASGAADRLPLDDERFLALRVKPPVRFLPVASFAGALEILRDTEVEDVIDLREPVYPEALSTMDLSRFDIVLWADANAHDVDERGAAAVTEFVRKGGGLLAYLGEYAQPERVNEHFFRERGEGLFPMLLEEGKQAEVVEGETPWTIDLEAAKEHPLFRETEIFRSHSILRFRRVREVLEGSVVARYDSAAGDPAVLEHRLGRGRVLVVTTTPDERGFRMDGSFLPAIFFINAAHYLVAEDPALWNVTVGRPIRVPLPLGARRVAVEPPEAAGGVVEEQIDDASKPFTVSNTAFPGFYRLTVRGMAQDAKGLATEEVHLAAANADAAESDLRRLAPTELPRLYRDTGLELAGESEELVPAAGGAEAGELSRALLGVVAAILFLELVLAWRFGTRRRLATP
jgi:hypothetical protein